MARRQFLFWEQQLPPLRWFFPQGLLVSAEKNLAS